MARQKIIFDTDPGIDDAMALLLLARSPEVELIGVTTVLGNASIDTVTRNALFLKQKFGFAAPVARGAAKPLVDEAREPPAHIHGRNGLGDIPLPPITATLDPRPAHQLIVDLVRQFPHEVTLIAVGRMTNLALALDADPAIAGLVRQVVVMGGAFGRNGHTGNVTPVAEANIIGDPHAADIVFGAGWPMTIVGLDVTHEVMMSRAYIDRFAIEGGEDGRFVRDIVQVYLKFYAEIAGIDGFPVHDSSAVAYALHPEFFTVERGTVRVVPDGIARGQTILKPEHRAYPVTDWDDRPLVNVCTGVDAEAVLRLHHETLAG